MDYSLCSTFKGGVIINDLKAVTTQFGLWYLAGISLIALIVTVIDKLSAKAHGRRVPESTLLLISVLGGSAVMYATMLLIRHKTKHIKFMVGIPLIMAAQGILVVVLYAIQ